MRDPSLTISKDLERVMYPDETYQNPVKESELSFSSELIKNENIIRKLTTLIKSKSPPKLLYKGTRDGFSAKTFHSKCDNNGPTLSIVKSEPGNIFGGLKTVSWQSPGEKTYFPDESAFIFKVIETDGQTDIKVFKVIYGRHHKAVFMKHNYGISFGYHSDFHISTESSTLLASHSKIGNSYESPEGIEPGSQEARHYLPGGSGDYFRVKEIEIFSIDC